jgi:hypothetical protein
MEKNGNLKKGSLHLKKLKDDYSSRGLKTPFFALRILHSGHRQESGTSSHAVPGGIPFFGSPFNGS